MNRYLCLLLLVGISQKVMSQTPPVNEPNDATDLIEILVEDQEDGDFGFDTFLEQWELFIEEPLDLNHTSYEVLRSSGLFSEVQIRELIRHRELTGNLVEIYELQTLGSYSLNDIRRLQPFITTKQDAGSLGANLLTQHTTGRYTLFMRSTQVLEQQRGYQINDPTLTNPYLGNNQRWYTRFRYTFKNELSYGFTAEKDPGEPFGGETQPTGFDYWSAHYFKRSDGWLRAIALGDYEVRFGQGLILWSGFRLGKSIYPINVKRTGNSLSPYSSVNENRFFRGAGAVLGSGNFELTLFGSYNRVDGNITLTGVGDSLGIDDPVAGDVVLEISSLQQSGLHRTQSELTDKDAVSFITTGGQLAYNSKSLSLALSGVAYQIGADLNEDLSPYELYDFTGNRLINGSFSYTYFYKNALLYGETAMSDNGKAGTLNGLIIPIDRKIDLAIVQRYFDPGFQTLFSETFSENTLPRNESGWYAGIEVTPVKAWKINGYIDVYKSPWLEFNADAPSYGVDYLGTITYKPNRNFETYFRVRHEISDQNANATLQGEIPHDIIVQEARTRIRWNLSYKVTREITLRNRVEYSRFDEGMPQLENGYLLYQDITYKPWEKPWSIATRYTIFNTDSYDTRIYTYESDLLYAYSIANLSGTGQRYYLLLQYSPTRWMDTWVKVVQTRYTDRDEIGTGNEQITGNTRSELRLQIRFKW